MSRDVTPSAPASPLRRALKRLATIDSLLQTGAHPDDESSALLARLSLGDGARVVYACATRGEGGQNAIGPERDAALGALRALEMAAAAQALDLQLHWLSEGPGDPLHDFGFARSAEATFAIWGRERLVERLVHAIRLLRPAVVMPTFLDVAGQHGHHRAVTQATIEAFARAGDAAAFPEHARAGLAPWRAAKLYLPAWSGAGDTYDDASAPPPASLVVEAGAVDPASGLTYAQLGEASRAAHRSQGMGAPCAGVPHPVPLHRLAARDGIPPDESSPFDHLPRTLGQRARSVEDATIAPALRAAQDAIERALSAFPDLAAIEPQLREAAAAIARAQHALPGRLAPDDAADIVALLAVKLRELDAARRAMAAHGDAPEPIARIPPPGISLSVEPDAIAWNRAAPPRAVEIAATLRAPAGIHRIVAEAPEDWRVVPGAVDVEAASGEKRPIAFALAATETAGSEEAVLRWRVDGAPARGVTRIVHPDHGATDLVLPTATALRAIDARWPAGRIGHVDGGADRVGERLRRAGLDLDALDADALADPARWDTILVGVFAWRTRPELRAAAAQLRTWMRDGGHLVTLYHRPTDGWDPDRTPAFRIAIGRPSWRWRVCDPSAPVEILAPDHPFLTRPNRIGPLDWSGWVRERGLHFPAEWAPEYETLVAMADPGEARLEGGLLTARIGAGRHTHVSLALHLQLDALVPGAYRLMANLLAPARA